MVDDLRVAMVSSLAALKAQSTRLRVVSENLANASSTAAAAGGTPYVRKTITFKGELDRASGASIVLIDAIGIDRSAFRIEHDPGHPAADAAGNVKFPNVNPLVELADLREAHRSYDANLQVIRQTRDMVGDLIDLLRGK
ncbi:MAG: flagellar basal body rod protein FlgC [Hyphomicrobiaceae bacterium]